jgi:hypothetical protein
MADRQLNAAFDAIMDANERSSGATYSELLMTFARVALEAAERVRSSEQRLGFCADHPACPCGEAKMQTCNWAPAE